MTTFEIVGAIPALVSKLNIASRVIEDQSIEIAQLKNEIHDYKDQIFALRLKNHNKKPNLNVVKVYQFPDFTPRH